jgi:Holliday junction resolvase RusA-like endonuclease
MNSFVSSTRPAVLAFTIPGDVVPAQPGRLLSNGVTQTSVRAKQYRTHAKYHTLLHVRRTGWETSAAERFAVSLRVFVGDLRTIDVDNCAKNLLDALKKIAFGDDAQVIDLHVRKTLDRERPRVEIEVRRIVDA